jgi:uncharacterized membrane protein
MSLISRLSSYNRIYNQNPENSLQKLISCLDIKISKTSIEKTLIEHPDYPSLLSISDALASFHIENITVRSTIEKLKGLPAPLLLPIKSLASGKEFFTVVRSANNNSFNYYNPEKNNWENIAAADLEKKWQTKVVMIADAEDAHDEKDFKEKNFEEKRKTFTKAVAFLAIPVVAIIASVFSFISYGQQAILPAIFLMLSLSGSVIGGLLLWYELDEYNPVLQQICSAGKKVNCGAILNSKASKIAGISWSAIGFAYFTGGLFAQLFMGILNIHALTMLAWFNVLAVPYIFFSIYYQWRIAKQWCLLCLGVQSLLMLQFVVAITAGWHKNFASVIFNDNIIIVVFVCSYLVPFIIVSLLLPAYQSAKESRHNKAELLRLKHNPQIFEALLEKQKAISILPKDLGITIGNPNATQKIIKVCNPYCGPCAKAHKPIEELIESNPDVQVQIIFTATNSENDIKALPVKHLLAIAEKNDEPRTRQALDDWYLTDKKDYEAFAVKYPMNGELKQQEKKLDEMSKWCENAGISFTPTFFVASLFDNDRIKNENKFYQMPEIYSVSDLKYFFLSAPKIEKVVQL